MINYIGGFDSDEFDSDEESVPILSSPTIRRIITIGAHNYVPPTLRTISLKSLRDIIISSKCQLCSIITAGLPKEVEQDLLKIIPGDFWVMIDMLKLVTQYC